MTTPRSSHVTRSAGSVSRKDRGRLLGQRGCVVWLTGLSGSGKSTLAHELEQRLLEAGRLTYVLDGDNLRHGLCGDLDFSPESRTENIRRAGEVAALLADVGAIVLASFISPYRSDRKRVRSTIGTDHFLEVHVDASLEVCEGRDPKGLYKKARQGLIPEFTGIDAPYEPPENPQVRVDTGKLSIQDAAAEIQKALSDLGFLTSPD
ncbi:MAG: adenylyl-sulfate kinase [Planctomycetota bacterium]|nr:adenylyl-sulfate kinase [Planctomycetota bacterium]